MKTLPPDNEGFGMILWGSRNRPEDPTASFKGKTVLITGANTGLGFEAALKFARLGAACLILGVRSLKKGEEARARISDQAGFNPDDIKLREIDMGSYESVKEFADQVSKEPYLHVAILNAGLAAPSRRISLEGYEMSLQVHALSTALLSIMLLPQLRKTSLATGIPTHLEIVGSIAGRGANLDELSDQRSILDQVNDPSFFTTQKQYVFTKLFEFYVMQGLVQATESWQSSSEGPDVIINAVCPGLCRTTLGRDFPAIIRGPMNFVHGLVARTAEEGARSYVSGVTLGKEAHGELWSGDMFFK